VSCDIEVGKLENVVSTLRQSEEHDTKMKLDAWRHIREATILLLEDYPHTQKLGQRPEARMTMR